MATEYLDFEKPILELEQKIAELSSYTQNSGMDFSQEISTLQGRLASLKEQTYKNLTRWQRVCFPPRPAALRPGLHQRHFPRFL